MSAAVSRNMKIRKSSFHLNEITIHDTFTSTQGMPEIEEFNLLFHVLSVFHRIFSGRIQRQHAVKINSNDA